MRIRRDIFVLLLLSIYAVNRVKHEQKLSAQEQSQNVEFKKIPVDFIYSTSQQKGFKTISDDRAERVFRNYQCGASNVFLAGADDVQGAVQATMRVLTASVAVDNPVMPDQLQPKSEQYWMVAFLGASGSNPPAWVVKSAEVKDKRVRLVYVKGIPQTFDIHQYFFWIPIGKLQPATYYLELFDEDQKQISLVRQVVIPNNK